MKNTSIILFALALSVNAMSQNETDALRFSQNYVQGTARSMAMGGAFGAIGSDFTSLSINPAGIGLYRSNEFSLSPTFLNSKTESVYNGTYGDDVRSNLSLANLGFVMTNKANLRNPESPWRFFQFGFGMNRTNAFHNRHFIQGDNDQHSKIDVYLDRVWNTNPANIENDFPYDIYPAWYVYLIDTVRDANGNLVYTSPVLQGGITQYESVNTWGSTNEWVFSAGANFNDRLYLGATFGIPYVRFFRESTYTEKDVSDRYIGFDEWSYTEKLETRGAGINLKIGAIVRPADWIRVGAAFHTPTYFSELHDVWSTKTEAYLEPDYNAKSSPTGEYYYDLSTPLRAIGSLAFVLGQHGIISADYEYADYSTMRMRAPDYTFRNENQNIRDFYTATHNLRFGAEWRVGPYSLRGGYALYGSPYAHELNNGKRSFTSFGLGYNERSFSIDLAYVHGIMKQDYYLYTSENYSTHPTAQTQLTNQFVLSTRFRF